MEACRNATLVASWALAERLSNAFEFPLGCTRWVNDGDAFDADDRRFRAVRPPGHHALPPLARARGPAKFAAFADRVQSLVPRTIASAHSPVIPEAYVAQAFDLVLELPEITPPALPELDAILGGVAA